MESKPHAIVGIDYSFSCPSVCIHTPAKGPFGFESCKIHYLCDTAKRREAVNSVGKNLIGEAPRAYGSNEERFHAIAWWVVGCLAAYKVRLVMIENYAFAAKGQVFQIGENTGQLKHQLWTHKIPFMLVAPTEVKKFATGSGNADKLSMIEKFVSETGVNILAPLNSVKDFSPVADIVDSYYITKWAVESLAKSDAS